jgi:hypothetical protein
MSPKCIHSHHHRRTLPAQLQPLLEQPSPAAAVGAGAAAAACAQVAAAVRKMPQQGGQGAWHVLKSATAAAAVVVLPC